MEISLVDAKDNKDTSFLQSERKEKLSNNLRQRQEPKQENLEDKSLFKIKMKT
ncbi:hypothetical protein MA16_Dca015701 [Dendrobium catenatum]|uniref:Uncharacterized protein n=1 Tax=Dendrobium catenatum TaxID=906689 RepID=A0A2I0V8G7_9ASPA|nr:hypothetical protein MA16_Dca015701 [Dendrobium catenatum]